MHEPLKRLVPGAENAVLFIHGIAATPRFFDDFAAIVPADWSLHSVLLPGHGGSVREFGRHSSAAWRAHVHATLEELRLIHPHVYIVGHSLGTLLAIREAIQDDRGIAGMLLLCVPLRIRVKPSALLPMLCKGLGLSRDSRLPTYYGMAPDWRVWRYIGWLPRYAELFRESAATRREIPRLTVSAIAFAADQDELVSPRSLREMARCPAIVQRHLPASRHYAFPPADKAVLLSALREMCGF